MTLLYGLALNAFVGVITAVAFVTFGVSRVLAQGSAVTREPGSFCCRAPRLCGPMCSYAG